MRNTILSLALVTAAGCATTGALDHSLGHSVDPSSHASGVQLDFAARTDSVNPTFPAVMEPALPSADRIAPRIRQLAGDNVSADIDLCVAASGKVARVELARSSTYGAFDTAMMRDVASWQFASTPGPESLKSCERFTISYRVAR